MKKTIITVFVAALIIVGSIAWCGGQQTGSSSAGPIAAMSKWEYKRGGPTLVKTPDSFYSYDDLTKKVDITMVINGWVPDQPFPSDDPIRKYFEKKFNCTMNFTSLGTDTTLSKLIAQIAAGKAPDIVGLWQRTTALKLYEQGALAGDHSQYLKYVPAITQQYSLNQGDMDLLQAVREGVLYAIPKHQPAPEYYWLQIRQDWLDKLGMKQPVTDTELMKVAEAFTFKDPDGNGKADTWGFSIQGVDANALASNWGGLEPFMSMYGNPGWEIQNNQLINPVVSEARLKYLKFFRTAIEKGVMDPDYMSNPDFHPKKLIGGRAGIFAYHTDITNEAEGAMGKIGELTGVWRMLDKPLQGDDGKSGGKRRSCTDSVFMWLAFTKQGAQDQVKVKRLLHMLDWWQYPNDGQKISFYGYGVPEFPNVTEIKSKDSAGVDYIYYGMPDDPRSTKPGWVALWNWATPGQWYPRLLFGGTAQPSKTIKYTADQMRVVASLPMYSPNLYYLCDVPSEQMTKAQDIQAKGEVAFLTGKRSFSEWDAYAKEWKDGGGQEIYDLMVKQLKGLGLLK